MAAKNNATEIPQTRSYEIILKCPLLTLTHLAILRGQS
jgi:hypothetical protein